MCKEDTCLGKPYGHGYCERHYRRRKRLGETLPSPTRGPKRRPLTERFWEKVSKTGPIHPILGTPCWLWTGTVDRGYGTFKIEGWSKKAYKVAWWLIHGDVPVGRHLHHLCETKLCVNPDHLKPLTQAEHNHAHAS